MLNNTNTTFGPVRNFFWPIHRHELKKIIPMFVLFFLITFINNTLRNLKVTLVVNSDPLAAQLIPYLKVWAVLPGALFMTYLFTKLSNYFNREGIFYAMIAIFLSFFIVFAFYLYPNREHLQLTEFYHWALNFFPQGSKGLIAVVKIWPISLFYVLSEIWSSVILSMLFWGFANEVTSVDEAKRFYALFALGANSSGIFSGQVAQFLNYDVINSILPFGHSNWDRTVYWSLIIVFACTIVALVIFRWVNVYVVPHGPNPETNMRGSKFNKEPKLSLWECFTYLAKSPYMLYLTVIVVSYNIVYNLSDVLLTDQMQKAYPNPADFNAFISNLTSITGVIAVVSAFLISGNVIRRYGWIVAAMITPVIWLITSIGFFSCLTFNGTIVTSLMMKCLNLPLASLGIFFGGAQICLGKASKYTVFDETKEIVFIPLSKHNKRKGKAVIDGIASRLGKSGGSLIYQVLLFSFIDLTSTIPYIAIIILCVIIGWIVAVKKLGRLVNTAIDLESPDYRDPSMLKT